MNLIEKLLHVDKEKTQERETKKMKSTRLSKLIGGEAEITIREVSGKRMNELNNIVIDKNGKRDFSKAFDANAMYCVYGVIEPDLRDSRLMEHFGVKTPKDLAILLFDSEVGKIADEIIKLAGIDKETEEEVKNS